MRRIRRRKRNGMPLPVTTAAEAAKVARLKDHLLEKRGAVDVHTANYVQAALEYGVELTRSEYRPLANRNWKVIQRFGVRLIRLLTFLVIALAILGLISFNTINEIQDGRRHVVVERCQAGEEFRKKLHYEIKHLPPAQRAAARATAIPTEELAATIVPITRDDCRRALRAAGL